ncbi:hypothetical protein K503DRAFT_766563 [Rhizopogon vinicolor AM-OR11-026]|uniref:Uncharacterized protein n=1 Tax=Rhizopogon vinicolor AM-OR11-026 TaxID=1314800 RepID=A0A1B7NCL6_9AGAM|nr:hypothetical protein K503DRAFT_766563 [Rhizopogon vinicolor AM-OR11-026]
MTSYPGNLNDIDEPANIIDVDDDEYDSSDEDDFAPVPEDLIQGSMTDFSERGPQDKLAARAPDTNDRNNNRDKGDTKVPTVIKRQTDKEPRKIKADKYEADKVKPRSCIIL